eukprot:4052037-Ditylum_brightwellii.AAC.1
MLIHNNIKNSHVQQLLWDRASGKPVCMKGHFKQICTSDCPHTMTHTQPTPFTAWELKRLHMACKQRAKKRTCSLSQQNNHSQGNNSHSESE